MNGTSKEPSFGDWACKNLQNLRISGNPEEYDRLLSLEQVFKSEVLEIEQESRQRISFYDWHLFRLDSFYFENIVLLGSLEDLAEVEALHQGLKDVCLFEFSLHIIKRAGGDALDEFFL